MIEDLIESLGEKNVERVARAICQSEGVDPDNQRLVQHYEPQKEISPNNFVAACRWTTSHPEWTYRREEARKLIALRLGSMAVPVAAAEGGEG